MSELRQRIIAASRGEVIPTNINGPEYGTAHEVVRLSPRPIVVHVHSPGGSLWAGNWLHSIFNQVHVPICTMIDAEAASAATFLTVASPYRVMTSFGKCLIHDYSVSFGTLTPRQSIMSTLESAELSMHQVKHMYRNRSTIGAKQLDDLMLRDLWLHADECQRMNLCDRVVRPDVSAAALRKLDRFKRIDGMNIKAAPFLKTNWNIVYGSCSLQVIKQLDALLSHDDAAKPVVYMSPGDAECEDDAIPLACIPRFQSFGVPVFGVVDNVLDLWQFIPILFCHRRFMYDNAQIVVNMAYVFTWGRLRDVNENEQKQRDVISHILKDRARPTQAFIDDIFDTPGRVVPPEECLQMGLIDEIIPTGVHPLKLVEAPHLASGGGRRHPLRSTAHRPRNTAVSYT